MPLFALWNLLAAHLAELLDQFGLFFVEISRYRDFCLDEEVTAIAAVELWNALAAHTKDGCGLSPCRNFNLDFLTQAIEGDFIAKCGLSEGQGERVAQICAFAPEKRVILDCEDYVQIAILSALGSLRTAARNAERRAVLDSWRNLDRGFEFGAAEPAAAAFLAPVFDDPAFAGAGGAGRLSADGTDEALLDAADGTGTAASRTALGARARFSTGAGTFFALHFALVFDHGILAVQDFFERDNKLYLLVFAVSAAAARPPCLARRSKEEIEQVLDAPTLEKWVAACSWAVIGHSEAVVSLALLGIRKDRISLTDLFELFFRLRVVRVYVRMKLTCELAVCLLDLVLRGTTRHFQNIVQVPHECGLFVGVFVVFARRLLFRDIGE